MYDSLLVMSSIKLLETPPISLPNRDNDDVVELVGEEDCKRTADVLSKNKAKYLGNFLTRRAVRDGEVCTATSRLLAVGGCCEVETGRTGLAELTGEDTGVTV